MAEFGSSWPHGNMIPAHECDEDGCDICGKPSIEELSRLPHKVGGYDPANPNKACELAGCLVHSRQGGAFAEPPQGFELQGIAEGSPAKAPIEETQGSVSRRQFFVTSEGSPGYITCPSALAKFNHAVSAAPKFEIPSDTETEATTIRMPRPSRPSRVSRGFSGSVSDDGSVFPTPSSSPAPSSFGTPFRPSQEYLQSALVKKYRPMFFQEGIRNELEINLYSGYGCRAVVITGLQRGTAVRDIMSRIRGGKILKVTTADTLAGYTAMVQFVDSSHASEYVKIQGRFSIFGKDVDVDIAGTISYPLSHETTDDVMAGLTRLVVVLLFRRFTPSQYLDSFKFMFSLPEHIFEDVWMNERGTLHLLFKDLAYAAHYFKIVMQGLRHLTFQDKVYFAKDPCDRPLEELRNGPVLARGDYPSLLDAWLAKRDRTSALIRPAPSTGTDTTTAVTPTTPPVNVQPGAPTQTNEVGVNNSRQSLRDPFMVPGEQPHKRNLFAKLCAQQAERSKRLRANLQESPTWSSTSSDLSYSSDSPLARARNRRLEKNKRDIEGKKKAVREDLTLNINLNIDVAMSGTHESQGSQSSQVAGADTPHANPSDSSATTKHQEFPGGDQGEDMVPKYMLPQNDPAYQELLHRDHSDLVRKSEVDAIFRQQSFQTIPKDEMRERYRAFFPVREQMAAWKRGEEYDPDTPMDDEPQEEKKQDAGEGGASM
ncbi:hypothetical protein AAE478_001163 [Parahypoxylon ruwenzoriense]